MREFRLLVAIPSNGGWEPDTAMALAGLSAHFTNKIPGYDAQMMRTMNLKGSILSSSRQRALDQAIKMKATHLFFADSDMTFPADVVHQLAERDRQVVAANCATKTFPSKPTARLKSNEPYGSLVYSHDQRGIQRVWRIGTGIMLIRMSAIMHVPGPHFEVTWAPENANYRGEDWYFCEKLEKHGVPIFVDHDLSRQIGHIGSYTFTHDDIATGIAIDEARREPKDERQLELAI